MPARGHRLICAFFSANGSCPIRAGVSRQLRVQLSHLPRTRDLLPGPGYLSGRAAATLLLSAAASTAPFPTQSNRPLAAGTPLTNTPTRSNKPLPTPNSPAPHAPPWCTPTNASAPRTNHLGLAAPQRWNRRRPGRATLGRWVQHTARKAGGVLALRERAGRSLVVCLGLDAILCRRRPVLLGSEPPRLAWVRGTHATARRGPPWAQALAAGRPLPDVAAAGGSGLALGLERTAVKRSAEAAQATTQPRPLHLRLDGLHSRHDGAKALRRQWRQAQAVGEEAEQRERAQARFDQGGTDRRPCQRTGVDKAWAQAAVACAAAWVKERAWQQAVAAGRGLRPAGRRHDRQGAETALRAARALVTGQRWAKGCRPWLAQRALPFLDRLHEALVAAEPRRGRREALVALGRWRRLGRGREASAAQPARAVVADVVGPRLGRGWQKA